VQQIAERHRCVQLLDNPRYVTPVALNIGVRAARGAFVLWMSAHNRYERGYVAESIRWALATGADNVGGVIITAPRTAGLLADAITAVLTHRFGVGGSAFRLPSTEPRWTDTVFGGCYRRDVFERIGLFNEALTRGQDMEFNLRLARAGGRTLLVPAIRSVYYARTRLGEFLQHNWDNGVWAILPFRHSSIVPVSPRLLVPYGTASLVASAQVAWLRRAPQLFVVMPVVFALLHLSYGFGSLWALARSAVPLALRLVTGNRTPPRSAEQRADGPG
jgi:hypothetical protein